MDNKNCDGLEKTAVKILFHYIEDYLMAVERFPVKNVASKKNCLNRYVAKNEKYFLLQFENAWVKLSIFELLSMFQASFPI